MSYATPGSTVYRLDEFRPQPPQQHLNGAGREPPPGTGRPPPASPPPGHNSGAIGFDAIVKENLRRGLYRSQRDALVAVARDPRCTRRHVLVHAIVVGFMSSETGMAFPGWRAIAEKTATLPADVQDPAGAYDEGTIRNLLSDLNRWGYLPSVRRGPEGGGRAIAHYTITEPPYDKLREEITKFIMNGRDGRARDPEERKRLDALATRGPDVTTPGDIRGASDVTRGGDVSSDVTRGRAADVTRGGVTVTCKEEPEEKVGADAPGLPFDDPGQQARPKRTSAKSGRLTDREIDAHFEEWYAAYPKKKEPFAARKAYASAIKKGATHDQLRAALKAYQFTHEKQFIKNPAKWLNAGCWLEVTANMPKTFDEEVRALQAQHPDAPVDEIRAAVAESRRSRGLD